MHESEEGDIGLIAGSLRKLGTQLDRTGIASPGLAFAGFR